MASGIGFLSMLFAVLVAFSAPAFPAEAHGSSEAHSLSDRRCASFSQLSVPFFFLDKRVTYNLSALVISAPPNGWICKATHSDAPPQNASLVLATLFSSFFNDSLGSPKSRFKPPSLLAGDGGRKLPEDAHYEVTGGAPVYYAFNPCRVLSQDCVETGRGSGAHARPRRGRLFKYRGPVADGHCLENLLPHPLPLTPWRTELRNMMDREWLHGLEKNTAAPRTDAETPEGIVKDPEDARWDPLDVLEPEAGLQATFRFYEPSCPAQVVRVKVKVACAPDGSSGASSAESPFSLCQQLDACHFEMRMSGKAGCPTETTAMSEAVPFLFDLGGTDAPSSLGETQPASSVSPVHALPAGTAKTGEKAMPPDRSGQSRAAFSLGKKSEANPPALSVEATTKILDTATTLDDTFLIGELRSLASAGFLDASVKQRLASATTQHQASPKTANGASAQPALSSSAFSWLSQMPASSSLASLASSVPHTFRSFLTHQVVPGAPAEHSGNAAHLSLFLRISLCALIIFGAYWLIRDWITREFAVRGTLYGLAGKGGAGLGNDLGPSLSPPRPGEDWKLDRDATDRCCVDAKAWSAGERRGGTEAKSLSLGSHANLAPTGGVETGHGGYGSLREWSTVAPLPPTHGDGAAPWPFNSSLSKTQTRALEPKSAGQAAEIARARDTCASACARLAELEMELGTGPLGAKSKPMVIPLSPTPTTLPDADYAEAGDARQFASSGDHASQREEDWYEQDYAPSSSAPGAFASSLDAARFVENRGSGRTTTTGLSSEGFLDTRLVSGAVSGPSSFFVDEGESELADSNPWHEHRPVGQGLSDLEALELGAPPRRHERADPPEEDV